MYNRFFVSASLDEHFIVVGRVSHLIMLRVSPLRPGE